MKYFQISVRLVSIVLLSVLSVVSKGQEKEAPAEENVTVITSEQLTFESKRNYALFEGDVSVRDPEIDMDCDVMEVFFNEKSEIEKIIAQGAVLIQNKDMIAQAGHAVYDLKTEILTLTEDPKVAEPPADPKKVLQGGIIRYDQAQSKLLAGKGTRLILIRGKDEASPFKPGEKQE